MQPSTNAKECTSLNKLKNKALEECKHFFSYVGKHGPPLWSSGQSFCLQIQKSQVRFLALPHFLRSRGSGMGYTQPSEDN
jgi:hypothetical protein